MDSRLRRWELGGFLFTCAAGTLLHFAYEWSGENAVVGAFSAVNESVWEHMKLLFFPLFAAALAEMAAVGDHFKGFWTAKAAGIGLGLLVIPAVHYTYTGALGVSVMWVDIALFYVAAAAAFLAETPLLLRQRQRSGGAQMAAMLLLWALALLFVFFTYYPPHIPLFRDPTTMGYGLGK